MPLVPVGLAAAQRRTLDANPLTCVDRVARHDGRTVFAFLDFHPYVADPALCRNLREIRPRLEEHGQTIVFVSPAFTVPHDLEGDVLVFDVPLPTPEDLAGLLVAEQTRAGLELTPDLSARAVRAVQGLGAAAARLAFRRACTTPEILPGGCVEPLVHEKRRLLERTELLDFVDAPPSLDQIGGLEALKAWLVEREAAFGERAREFGLPTPKGLLLVGVQGAGKSLTAKAVAHLWNLPLARLDFGALFTFGRSPEENLRRVIRLSEALAPMVLWLDEVDKAFRGSGGGDGRAQSEVLSRIFASFITWLQEKTRPVFVVATANEVEHLPPELLRKGRFDETFFVDLPDARGREQILAIHVAAHGRDPAAFDLGAIAGQCEHMSGAELEQIVVAGLYRAFQKGRDLSSDDLAVAARGTVPLYRTYEEQIKALRDWAKGRARKASEDQRLAGLWGAGR